MKTMAGKGRTYNKTTNKSQRSKMHDTKAKQQRHTSYAHNAALWPQKRPKHLQLQPHLSAIAKNMSRILSSTSTKRPATVQRAMEPESEAETLSCSFQSSSSPLPGARVFSGAVFHGEHLDISINTVNRSPDYSATQKHTFKHVKGILDSLVENSPWLQ